MIEKTVLDYLAGALEVPVVMEVPEERPRTYVVIEKTGSGVVDRLPHATLAIRSVAPTLYDAAALCHAVKDVMADIILLPNVFHCHCETDYNFSDTRTKERRYQAVFQIYYLEE